LLAGGGRITAVIRKLDRWNGFRKCRLQLREMKSLLAGVILPSEGSLELRSQIRTLLQVQKTGIVLESSLEFRNFSNEPRKQITDETSESSLELTWQFLVRTAKNKSLAGNLRSSKSMSWRNMRGSRIDVVANF
jgi:hypothetical protein